MTINVIVEQPGLLDVSKAEAARIATAADRVATGQDRVATGQDRDATAADRVQTGLDRASATASATSSALSSAAAGAASGRLVVKTFAELATVPVYADPGDDQQITAAGDYIHVLEIDAYYLVLASGASGADLDYTGSDGVKLEVLAGADGYKSLAAFNPTTSAALLAAIEATDGIGLDWGNVSLSIDAAVSASVDVLRWKSNGATLTYTGASHLASFLSVTVGDGADHTIDGKITVDGDSKATSVATFVQPLGTSTTTLKARHFVAKNAWLPIGAGTSANCLKVQGGFSYVEIYEPDIDGAIIATDAGVGGTRGVQGILVGPSSATGSYPVLTRIIRPRVRNIKSQDVTYQDDMDGISFQVSMSDTANGRAVVEIIDPEFSDVWGREVKTQAFYSKVQNPTIKSASAPTGGRKFPMIDFQTGPGELIGGQYDIDGVTFATSAGVFRASVFAAAGPCTSNWRGGVVRLVNSAVLPNVAVLDPETTDKMVMNCVGQTVNGEIRNFGYIRTNGLDLHHMRVDGATVNLTDALIRTETRSGGSSPYRGRAWARNVINVGSEVPIARQSVSGVAAWAIVSADNCFGFEESSLYSGTSATAPAGRVEGIVYPEYASPDNLAFMQGRRMLAYSIANNAEVTLPSWGASGSCVAIIKVSAADRNAVAMISVDAGGIVDLASGTSFNIGTTSDPGSGTYRVWMASGQIVVKNTSGATRYFTVTLQG